MKLNTDCIKKTQSAENKVSEMLKLTFENSKNGEKHLTVNLKILLFFFLKT